MLATLDDHSKESPAFPEPNGVVIASTNQASTGFPRRLLMIMASILPRMGAAPPM